MKNGSDMNIETKIKKFCLETIESKKESGTISHFIFSLNSLTIKLEKIEHERRNNLASHE